MARRATDAQHHRHVIPGVDSSLSGLALKLVLAFVLALPEAFAQDRRSRSAGLRTYPLMAVGACGMVLLGQRAIDDVRDQADIMYGLLNSIGFIGSGALLKNPDEPSGMAAAVSLWLTAAMGAAVGYGLPVVALALSVTSAATFFMRKRS